MQFEVPTFEGACEWLADNGATGEDDFEIFVAFREGVIGVCAGCGETGTPGANCAVCLNAWADTEYAKALALEFGRLDTGKF